MGSEAYSLRFEAISKLPPRLQVLVELKPDPQGLTG